MSRTILNSSLDKKSPKNKKTKQMLGFHGSEWIRTTDTPGMNRIEIQIEASSVKKIKKSFASQIGHAAMMPDNCGSAICIVIYFQRDLRPGSGMIHFCSVFRIVHSSLTCIAVFSCVM